TVAAPRSSPESWAVAGAKSARAPSPMRTETVPAAASMASRGAPRRGKKKNSRAEAVRVALGLADDDRRARRARLRRLRGGQRADVGAPEVPGAGRGEERVH